MPTSSLPGLLPLEAAIQSVSMFFSGQTSPDRSAAQDPVSSPPPTPDTSRYIIIARERSSLYPMDPEILAGPTGCFRLQKCRGPSCWAFLPFLGDIGHSWSLLPIHPGPSLLRLHSALVTTLTPGPTSISAHLNPFSRVLSCIFSA